MEFFRVCGGRESGDKVLDISGSGFRVSEVQAMPWMEAEVGVGT